MSQGLTYEYPVEVVQQWAKERQAEQERIAQLEAENAELRRSVGTLARLGALLVEVVSSPERGKQAADLLASLPEVQRATESLPAQAQEARDG